MNKKDEMKDMSDNKMDILTEVSPIADNDTLLQSTTSPSLYITDNLIALIKDSEDNCKSSSHDIHQKNDNNECHNYDSKNIIKKKELQLDNGHIDANPMQQTVQKNISNLTLANSHPLMSPTGTDSDSENSYNHQKINNQSLQNIPDVVPTNYHIPSHEVTNVMQKHGTLCETVTHKTSLLSTKNAINSNPTRHGFQPTILRASSPDVISSESETELSQYRTSVEMNFQSVALVPNLSANNNTLRKIQPIDHANIGSTTGAISDDMSSLDSISNQSFEDDGIEHNLASLSPSSSLIEGLDEDDEEDVVDIDQHIHFRNLGTPTNCKPSSNLPIYSAEDESRDSRNWQKITLPDGRTREIDMKVIEPYKRVLSHGGYLHAGGQNAIVIFCACHLPDRSRTDYHYVMDNLFLYVVKTLEQLVTEDYVLIYLHGGSNRRNFPPFPWLKKCYQLLDRRLRKSLKNLYLVHPTFWIKSFVFMMRPFVSTKFWRKLVYVRSLEELSTYVSVEKAAIPDKVRQYDTKCI